MLVNPLQDLSLPLFPKLIQFLLNDAPQQEKKKNNKTKPKKKTNNTVQCFFKKNSNRQQKPNTFQLHGKLSF